jgi:Kef-type K+ transport system membrane component KefB
VISALLWVGWRFLHGVKIPVTWKWALGYAVCLTLGIELIYEGSKIFDGAFPIHIEILLPAFVLGCIMARPVGQNPHVDDAVEGHQDGPESPQEQRVSTIMAAAFMCLVGLSMPHFAADTAASSTGHNALATLVPKAGWGEIALHVAVITIISNIGKMFPAFCYRREAPLRERIALGIGLWPRGEVGGGVIVLSLSYGIGGPVILVAMLSLALNLLLTGVFIVIIKRIISPLYNSKEPSVAFVPGQEFVIPR